MVDPFARSLTKQNARKAPPHKGCGKIGRSLRCAPWHRSPGYDLRRASYDHPDFTSNALSEDLFSASLRGTKRNWMRGMEWIVQSAVFVWRRDAINHTGMYRRDCG